LDDEIDGSQPELPAVKPSHSSIDDFPSSFADLLNGEIAVTNLWYVDLVVSWRQYYFVAALGFGVLSLAILGFALISAVLGVRTIYMPITALIASGIALVAFSALLVTATALNLILAKLAITVRRLDIHPAQSNTMAGNGAISNGQTRPPG
jgi:hypothetical protein